MLCRTKNALREFGWWLVRFKIWFSKVLIWLRKLIKIWAIILFFHVIWIYAKHLFGWSSFGYQYLYPYILIHNQINFIIWRWIFPKKYYWDWGLCGCLPSVPLKTDINATRLKVWEVVDVLSCLHFLCVCQLVETNWLYWCIKCFSFSFEPFDRHWWALLA